jgi:glycerol kinase
MLMDINTLEWSDKMLQEYGIKEEWLPELVKKSSDDYGVLDCGIDALKGVPIGGVLGDQ